MLTETLFVNVPPFGVITGAATVAGAETLSAKAAVFLRLPLVAVTVIGKLPVGVAMVVETVSTEEQLGLQDVADQLEVAPEGSPKTLKETA